MARPLAAGNFLYIGASDLAREVNEPHRLVDGLLYLGAFGAGRAVLHALTGLGAH
jgi:hypothetical protein